MGGNFSKTVNRNITNVTSRILQTSTTNVTNSLNVTSTNIQNVVVNMRNSRGCSSVVNMKASIAMDVMMNNSTEVANVASAAISTALETMIKNTLEQVNEGLNLGQANVQETSNTIMTNINQEINTIVRTNITNSVYASARNKQTAVINLEGAICDPGISSMVSQEAITTLIAQKISDQITDTIMNNKIVADIKNKVENDTKQKNEGFNLNFLVIVIAVVAVFFMPVIKASSDYRIMTVLIVGIWGSLFIYYIFFKPRSKEEDLIKRLTKLSDDLAEKEAATNK